MYSRNIIDQNVWRVEKALKKQLTRYSPDTCIERTEEIERLNSRKLELSAEHKAFIVNEQILCQLDFEHWCARYCKINYDAAVGGGVGPLQFWEPQRLLLAKIAQKEEDCQRQKAAGDVVDGILIACNKSRQVGFTMWWRAVSMHRLTLHENTRGMAASLNPDLIREVYDRDKFIYDNLPSFLKPEVTYDVKDEHLAFKNNSRLVYQESTQKGAMGISRQFEIGHLTEVSQWWYPQKIQIDLLPAIPQSDKTLFGMEAVPYGRGGFWHEFTEGVRLGEYPRWIYVFIPWYAEPTKYRRTPPLDWKPSDAAILHAKKVSETSHLYTSWQRYMVPKDNLYWWETTREEYRTAGNLNYFLTNWAATPEESFQHSGRSAFPVEFLEQARNNAREGFPYEVTAARVI